MEVGQHEWDRLIDAATDATIVEIQRTQLRARKHVIVGVAMTLILGDIEDLPPIKSCPFCGGEPRVAWNDAFTLMILCPVCRCRSQSVDYLPWDSDPEEPERSLARKAALKALKRWNKRVDRGREEQG